MQEIKKVGVLSLGKIYAISGAIGGLVLGIIIALLYSVAGIYTIKQGGGAGGLLFTGFGATLIIILPIIYAGFGFIIGVIVSFAYNIMRVWLEE
ncbi:MAG: hypothetical protein QXG00_01325 [Candidatus Woesearchaeota archaeon]